jgi:hypothetical protein
MIDLSPALADLAQVELGHVHHGKSLVPVLVDPGRRTAFSEGGFRLSEELQNEALAEHHHGVNTSLLHERPELAGRTVARSPATRASNRRWPSRCSAPPRRPSTRRA